MKKMTQNFKNFDDFEENCNSVHNDVKNSNDTCTDKSKTCEFVPLSARPAFKSPPPALHKKGRVFPQRAVSCIIAVVSVAVFTLACVAIPGLVSYDLDSDSISAADTPDNVTDESVSPDPIPYGNAEDVRVFREYNGKVGAFFADGRLDFVIDVRFDCLPEYDRKLLAGGVIAQGEKEIASLTEALEP